MSGVHSGSYPSGKTADWSCQHCGCPGLNVHYEHCPELNPQPLLFRAWTENDIRRIVREELERKNKTA